MNTVYPVRASSWASLFDCAYKWEYEVLQKHRKPAGVRALLGTSIHAGTAVYDLGRLEHGSATIEESAETLVETLRHPEFEVDYAADDLQLIEAERVGLTLLEMYCRKTSPRYEFAAVEMETKPFDIDCGGGIIIRLTGTMDRSRLVKSSNAKRVADLKSGATAVQKGKAKTKGHGAQTGTYCLLHEHTTGETIDDKSEIIGLKTKGTPQVETGEIIGAKNMMVGDDTHPGMIEIAANMFRSGLFPPNPSSILCHPKYCARWNSCAFHL